MSRFVVLTHENGYECYVNEEEVESIHVFGTLNGHTCICITFKSKNTILVRETLEEVANIVSKGDFTV